MKKISIESTEREREREREIKQEKNNMITRRIGQEAQVLFALFIKVQIRKSIRGKVVQQKNINLENSTQ